MLKPLYCDPDYMVSDDGYVISKIKGTPLKPSINPRGYSIIKISKDGEVRALQLHRVVLMTFCGDEYEDGLQCNHKDGNKQNNKLENLEWTTAKENMKHAVNVLQIDFGHGYTSNNCEVPVACYDKRTGELFKRFNSQTSAAKYFCKDGENLSSVLSSINRAANKRRKTYHGYIWEKDMEA